VRDALPHPKRSPDCRGKYYIGRATVPAGGNIREILPHTYTHTALDSQRRRGVIAPVNLSLPGAAQYTGTLVLSCTQRHSRSGIKLQGARANERRGIRLEERK